MHLLLYPFNFLWRLTPYPSPFHFFFHFNVFYKKKKEKVEGNGEWAGRMRAGLAGFCYVFFCLHALIYIGLIGKGFGGKLDLERGGKVVKGGMQEKVKCKWGRKEEKA